jgi:hypothetical protein
MLVLIGLLILVGVALWAVNYAPFIDGNIKKIIYIIIVIITVVYLLKYFSIMPGL